MTPGRRLSGALTPVTLVELCSAIHVGGRIAMGAYLPPECEAVATAQAALETGRGAKMRAFNVGNVKASQSWIDSGGDWCMYECDERFSPQYAQALLVASVGKLRTDRIGGAPGPVAWLKSKNGDGTWTVGFAPDHVQCRFRAAPSLELGCADFISFFTAEPLVDRYRKAWSRMAAGDARGFCLEAFRAHYFTADPEVYARAVVSIAKDVLPMCQGRALGMGFDPEMVARVNGLIGETLSETVFHKYSRADLAA